MTEMFEQAPATGAVPPGLIPTPATPVESMSAPALTRGPAGASRARTLTLAAVGVGGAIAGLLIGVVVGRATVHPDPTASAQYQQLQQRYATDEQQIGNLQTDIDAARSTAAAAVQGAQESAAQLSQQAAALATQQAALASGQAALQSSQQVIAQNSITEGTRTVGTDIAPGTYRTSAAVPGECYWGIYKSGTNKSDILQNDIVTGGYATVKLSAGQDFEDHGCGTFVKQ